MSNSIPVIHIRAAETRVLRRFVLRPDQDPSACVYPQDDANDSFHLGVPSPVSNNEELVAVASFFREPTPSEPSGPVQLRIRGMAVLPEHRGKGVGRALVEKGLTHAITQDPPPTLVWCNARTNACGYYEKLGFTALGDEFKIEGIGPHFVMCRMI